METHEDGEAEALSRSRVLVDARGRAHRVDIFEQGQWETAYACTYDETGRVAEISFRDSENDSARAELTISYSYDDDGRIDSTVSHDSLGVFETDFERADGQVVARRYRLVPECGRDAMERHELISVRTYAGSCSALIEPDCHDERAPYFPPPRWEELLPSFLVH